MSDLERTARDAVEMYDRYCAGDETMDLHDLGAKLELVREALLALGIEANGVSRFGG